MCNDAIAEGDTVEILTGAFSEKWDGFKARVLETGVQGIGGRDYSQTWLMPLSDRPDGYYRSPFYWTTTELRKVSQ